MKSKYKIGTTIVTDYFSEPGEYEYYKIILFHFNGSDVVVKLYDFKENVNIDYIKFHIKEYNKLFFTENEFRVIKLKKLEN